jgi:hypothetical protein
MPAKMIRVDGGKKVVCRDDERPFIGQRGNVIWSVCALDVTGLFISEVDTPLL